jgi:hypothetical protein
MRGSCERLILILLLEEVVYVNCVDCGKIGMRDLSRPFTWRLDAGISTYTQTASLPSGTLRYMTFLKTSSEPFTTLCGIDKFLVMITGIPGIKGNCPNNSFDSFDCTVLKCNLSPPVIRCPPMKLLCRIGRKFACANIIESISEMSFSEYNGSIAQKFVLVGFFYRYTVHYSCLQSIVIRSSC